MLKLSQAEVSDAMTRAQSLARRARGALEKADAVVDRVVKTTVTGGTAFGFGVAQGRWGGIEVLGVPADLGFGVLAHVAGFAGIGGKATDYMHAAGDGALACYLATLGRGVGRDWSVKATGSAPQLPAAAASGHTVSDAELARMAAGA